MKTLENAFDEKARAWETYTQTPAGRLREELNWHYLLPHLPPAPATILDVGSGTGGLGLRLAEAGYNVHLLDLSSEMLTIARQKAAKAGVEANITFHHQGIERWQNATQFNAIICHTLLEYLPDTSATINQLAQWIQPNGILSLVFVNRYAEPLSLALGKHQLSQALQALESQAGSADLFGVPRRLFTSHEMIEIIQQVGLTIVAEYGVRLIADYAYELDWKNNPQTYEELFQLEMKLAQEFPYRYIGRYGQLICKKPN